MDPVYCWQASGYFSFVAIMKNATMDVSRSEEELLGCRACLLVNILTTLQRVDNNSMPTRTVGTFRL